VIFLNPFTVRSFFKRKFVICSLVDEDKNASYIQTENTVKTKRTYPSMPLLNTRNLPITGLNLCLKSTYPIFFITVLVFKLLADIILYTSNIPVATLT
jgi:hypothetical protein